MKMHVHTEEQADTITLMLPAIKNSHKVHLLQYALCLPPSLVSSLGRILMSGGATDGQDENKSMETMAFGNAVWPQRWQWETRWRRWWLAQAL